MEYFLQLLIAGIAIGGLYALIAVGFVVIFKATGVLNFAHGELILVGAYMFYTFNSMLHIHFFLSFILTLCFSFVLALVIEHITIRPLLGEEAVSVIMLTIGISILIKAIIVIIWGNDDKVLPHFFPTKSIEMFGIYLPVTYIYMLGSAVLFFLIVMFFFTFTKMGLAMRATANNQNVALLMGINVESIFAFSWGLSAILAGVAGIFLSYINMVSPYLGSIGLNLFPAVVVGGLDSILGGIIGGFLIGILQNFAGGYLSEYLGGGLKEIVPFIILLLMLMIRPFGLFGKKEIERV